ncbi:MAG: nuclear transport factor 2 family protein [bacterium]
MTLSRTGAGILLVLTLGVISQVNAKPDLSAERVKVEKVIRASIEWATTKDTTLLYSSFAQDSALFWFSPDSAGTVRGFEAFKQQVEQIFMNPAFKAVGSEFIDLDVHFSGSGEVAWYSCILNDRNTWNGKPANWENVRWTGVLEKRDRGWVIVQMHFSYSEEDMLKRFKPEAPKP